MACRRASGSGARTAHFLLPATSRSPPSARIGLHERATTDVGNALQARALSALLRAAIETRKHRARQTTEQGPEHQACHRHGGDELMRQR